MGRVEDNKFPWIPDQVRDDKQSWNEMLMDGFSFTIFSIKFKFPFVF